MRIENIVYLGLCLICFASCSQDLEIEEVYQGQEEQLIPLNIGLKMACTDQENTRRNIKSGGVSEGSWSTFAYYNWEIGDQIGVVSPDSPTDNQQAVYEIESTDDEGLGEGEGARSTAGLTRKQGTIGYLASKKSDLHRIYVGYPANHIKIKEPIALDTFEQDGTLTFSEVSCKFEATISPNQTGTLKEVTDKVEGDPDYIVGDWTQAVCGGAFALKPEQMDPTSWTKPSDRPYVPVLPLFTEAEVDFTIPEGCTQLESVVLKAVPKINGTSIPVNICGEATGQFTAAGPMVTYADIQTKPVTEGAQVDNMITLNVSGDIEGNKKVRASLFFFPIGENTASAFPSTPSMKVQATMDVQIGITYKVGGKSLTKVAKLGDVTVYLGGRNHTDLGTLPKE